MSRMNFLSDRRFLAVVSVFIVCFAFVGVYEVMFAPEQQLTAHFVDEDGNVVGTPFSFYFKGGVCAGVYATVSWSLSELTTDVQENTFEISGRFDMYYFDNDAPGQMVFVDTSPIVTHNTASGSANSEMWMFADWFIPADYSEDEGWTVFIYATLNASVTDDWNNILYDDWTSDLNEKIAFTIGWQFETGIFGVDVDLIGPFE